MSPYRISAVSEVKVVRYSYKSWRHHLAACVRLTFRDRTGFMGSKSVFFRLAIAYYAAILWWGC